LQSSTSPIKEKDMDETAAVHETVGPNPESEGLDSIFIGRQGRYLETSAGTSDHE
jgi:hypothetical protein